MHQRQNTGWFALCGTVIYGKEKTADTNRVSPAVVETQREGRKKKTPGMGWTKGHSTTKRDRVAGTKMPKGGGTSGQVSNQKNQNTRVPQKRYEFLKQKNVKSKGSRGNRKKNTKNPPGGARRCSGGSRNIGGGGAPRASWGSKRIRRQRWFERPPEKRKRNTRAADFVEKNVPSE